MNMRRIISIILLVLMIISISSVAVSGNSYPYYEIDRYSQSQEREVESIFSLKGMLKGLYYLFPFVSLEYCERTENDDGIIFRNKRGKLEVKEDTCWPPEEDTIILRQWDCNNYQEWFNSEDEIEISHTDSYCTLGEETCINNECVSCQTPSSPSGAEPTCNDKIQNQGEKGIDCGNPPCPNDCVPFCLINDENPKIAPKMISECGIFPNECKEEDGQGNIVIAYTCPDVEEPPHCPPEPEEVACPGEMRCYKGLCLDPEHPCTDTDPDNEPEFSGFVQDSVAYTGSDYCGKNGQLYQADCECPNPDDKTNCINGSLKYEIYELGSPEAQLACESTIDEPSEEESCALSFCLNGKILGYIECPNEFCIYGNINYQDCPEGTTCIDGACQGEEITCQRVDQNGEEAGGGVVNVSNDPDEYYDECPYTYDVSSVREMHCSESQKLKSKGNYVLVKGNHCSGEKVCYQNAGEPAACIPPIAEKSCERHDPDPNKIGGGYAEATNGVGNTFTVYDKCNLDGSEVIEYICVNDVSSPQDMPCPAEHICYQESSNKSASCVPKMDGWCNREDNNESDPGGGWASCLDPVGSEKTFIDKCYGIAKVWEYICKSDDPQDCLKNKMYNPIDCPPGKMCFQESLDQSAVCIPAVYDECLRYESSPDPNNPTVGHVVLKREGLLDEYVYDICLTPLTLNVVQCPQEGTLITKENLNYEEINCDHCAKLGENYPSNGYCPL